MKHSNNNPCAHINTNITNIKINVPSSERLSCVLSILLPRKRLSKNSFSFLRFSSMICWEFKEKVKNIVNWIDCLDKRFKHEAWEIKGLLHTHKYTYKYTYKWNTMTSTLISKTHLNNVVRGPFTRADQLLRQVMFTTRLLSLELAIVLSNNAPVLKNKNVSHFRQMKCIVCTLPNSSDIAQDRVK